MNMDISTIYPQDIPISILFLITAFPLTTQQAPGHHAPLTFPHVIQARDGEIIGLGGKSSTYPGYTRWCPPSYKLVYNSINYRYITNKNHSYWSYLHQLSYPGGTTL